MSCKSAAGTLAMFGHCLGLMEVSPQFGLNATSNDVE